MTVALERPSEGNPCPNPKCNGRMMRGYTITWRVSETSKTGYGRTLFSRGQAEKICTNANKIDPDIDHSPYATSHFLCDACGWMQGEGAHAG